MKAYVLHGVNDIRLEEVDKPGPGKGEVLLKVMACGVCGSDIPRIYQNGAHNMPLIPGHEFSGIIEEIGEGVSEKLAGKRAGVFPLIPCRECKPCRDNLYEMCRSYDYLGSRSDGAYAEYVKVREWNIIELPDSVSYEAAAMLEPISVALHAIRRVDLNKKDRIAVCGMGTIGQLILMILISSGYSEIYSIGKGSAQKERACSSGLLNDRYCDTRKEDTKSWIREKAGDIDVYFECVGKNETLSLGVECAAPRGRIVTVGNPYSDMTLDRDIYWKILRNQLTVSGTWNSSFTHDKDDDWHKVIDMMQSGLILPERLITHRLSLSDLEKGLHIMRDRTEDYCKVMMTAETGID